MKRLRRAAVLSLGSLLALSGCGFSPYDLPLPGGADVGSDPYTVKVQFRDVLDLVPQSAVRVDDIAVGKVTKIQLTGWTAEVTLKINRDVKLPDNAEATIRQTSLLGEKFVSLAPPPSGATGRLSNGDQIPLDRSGRNPDIEEVLGAASLLFNGGGLDKTNTIVREFSKTLDGNEPEIKELLQNATSFLGQLDQNKDAIIGALEKINRLAVTTNQQTGNITRALDDLPSALKVVNDQRDDLVGLLQSLNRLGDVATGVIKRSKADTLRTLRDLQPTLKGLADAGDALPQATRAFLSFPFTDGVVGNSLARAELGCSSSDMTIQQKVSQGACFGDYYNLSIRLQLDPDQVTNLLKGVLSLGESMGLPSAPALPTSSSGDAASGGATSGAGADQLVDLVDGLVQSGGGGATLGDLNPTASPSASPKASTSGSGAGTSGRSGSSGSPGGLSGLCSILGSCRTSVASDFAEAARTDVGRLLLAPVVNQ